MHIIELWTGGKNDSGNTGAASQRFGAAGLAEAIIETLDQPLLILNADLTVAPHWRRWLGVESRRVVPFTSFAEPDPARKQEGQPVPNTWFALSPERPLAFFAGVWTPWRGVRRVRDGEQDFDAFLTCAPNAVVAPIHEKAMPVILASEEDVETWLTAPWEEARTLQRPCPDDRLVIVEAPPLPEDEGKEAQGTPL